MKYIDPVTHGAWNNPPPLSHPWDLNSFKIQYITVYLKTDLLLMSEAYAQGRVTSKYLSPYSLLWNFQRFSFKIEVGKYDNSLCQLWLSEGETGIDLRVRENTLRAAHSVLRFRRKSPWQLQLLQCFRPISSSNSDYRWQTMGILRLFTTNRLERWQKNRFLSRVPTRRYSSRRTQKSRTTKYTCTQLEEIPRHVHRSKSP